MYFLSEKVKICIQCFQSNLLLKPFLLQKECIDKKKVFFNSLYLKLSYSLQQEAFSFYPKKYSYFYTVQTKRLLFSSQDQYRVLYLALMETFCGPPKAETKETFLSNYHGKTSFHKNGDVSQKVNLATEFQVFVSFHKNLD